MKASPSIPLIMQLAGREATAAEFDEIEPEHLLQALLKFAELDAKEAESLVEEYPETSSLKAELETLRQELERFSIHSTRLRRKLRRSLGYGDRPYTGGGIHRSRAARQIFDSAVKLAAGEGKRLFTAGFLLRALLESPTDLIAQMVGAQRPDHEAAAEIALFSQHGELLSGKASGLAKTRNKPRPEAKALIRGLSQKGSRCVVLVGEEDQTVRETAIQLAVAIAEQHCPSALKGKLVYCLSVLPINAEALKTWERLFAVAKHKSVIVFLPCIRNAWSEAVLTFWLEMVKQTFWDGLSQCVMRVEPEAYKRLTDSFKRFARTMWLPDGVQTKLPTEL
jgi:ATP-dependent Clp protease ATP-binding subunit ClpA